jgi:hypothetical protein
MYSSEGVEQIFPTTPFLYVSTLWPLMHVVTTARAIETAAVQRRSEDSDLPQDSSEAERAAARQRLPRWAAAAFLVLAILACWAPFLFLGARDRYPFDNGDECRPCVCSAEAMLESCTIPATLGVKNLYIDGKGIRGIVPGVFRGLSDTWVLVVSHNNISALPAGAFDGLDHLITLSLSANALRTLTAGAFDGLPMLATLFLRDNPLAALRAGDFAGLGELRNLFLDGSDELRVVEPGVFAATPRVANVWVGGSALNCTRFGLPGGVTCFDEVSCDVEPIVRVGNGICDVAAGYNTAACAWDGGDCA